MAQDKMRTLGGEFAAERTRLANLVRPSAKSVLGVKAFLLGIEDSNNDGKFDDDEFTAGLFESLDTDGDGKLDKSEFAYHPDLVDPDGGGQTMLLYAASAGRLEVVRFLVSADADIQYRDYSGETALQKAMQNGHNDVVAYLRNPTKDDITMGCHGESIAKVRSNSENPPFPYWKARPGADPVPFPPKFEEHM